MAFLFSAERETKMTTRLFYLPSPNQCMGFGSYVCVHVCTRAFPQSQFLLCIVFVFVCLSQCVPRPKAQCRECQ